LSGKPGDYLTIVIPHGTVTLESLYCVSILLPHSGNVHILSVRRPINRNNFRIFGEALLASKVRPISGTSHIPFRIHIREIPIIQRFGIINRQVVQPY
jgi:hypothetical protein